MVSRVFSNFLWFVIVYYVTLTAESIAWLPRFRFPFENQAYAK